MSRIDPCAPTAERVAPAAELTLEEVVAMQQYEAMALSASPEAAPGGPAAWWWTAPAWASPWLAC